MTPDFVVHWLRRHTVYALNVAHKPERITLSGTSKITGACNRIKVPLAVWAQVAQKLIWIHDPGGAELLQPGELLRLRTEEVADDQQN